MVTTSLGNKVSPCAIPYKIIFLRYAAVRLTIVKLMLFIFPLK